MRLNTSRCDLTHGPSRRRSVGNKAGMDHGWCDHMYVLCMYTYIYIYIYIYITYIYIYSYIQSYIYIYIYILYVCVHSSSIMKVTFYGQKTVLLNNYLYGFNMVCHLWSWKVAPGRLWFHFDFTMFSLWFLLWFHYDFTMALLTPNLVILEFVNKI